MSQPNRNHSRNYHNRQRQFCDEDDRGIRLDTTELFSAAQVLRWFFGIVAVTAVAAISYNNIVSSIEDVSKIANATNEQVKNYENRIQQLEAYNETTSIRSTARIENLEKRLDLIMTSMDKTSDSIKELSGQVRDLGNMVAVIATKTDSDLPAPHESDFQASRRKR